MADEPVPKLSLDALPSKWDQFHWDQGIWNPLPVRGAKFSNHFGGLLAGNVNVRDCRVVFHNTFAGSMELAKSGYGVRFHSVFSGELIGHPRTASATFRNFFSGQLRPAKRLVAHFNNYFTGILTLAVAPKLGVHFNNRFTGKLTLTVRAVLGVRFDNFFTGKLPLVKGWRSHATFPNYFNGSALETPTDHFVPPPRISRPDRSGTGGGARDVSSRLVWAICPRCGFKYYLSEMREEIYDQRPTGRRVCPECFDQDDPHLALYRMDLDDVGVVRDPLPVVGRRDSISYAAGLFPAQWDTPIETEFGPFYILVGGVDVTPPRPPTDTGSIFSRIGAMRSLEKETKNGVRSEQRLGVARLGRWNRPER